MKRLTQFLLFSFLSVCTLGIKAQSCCESKGAMAFANFGKDINFVGSHDLPGDYIHDSKSGEMITYKTAGDKDAKAFVLRKEGSNKWLVVIHEWWGLNEYIKKESEKLYHDLGDVNVIALDMYDGNVATTREKAREYMGMVTEGRASEIIEGAFSYAGKNAKIATIGWCFGGGWSLNTSIMAGNKGIGCVVYYGMPVENIEKLKTLNGPVLGIFAKEDQWINPEVVKNFEANMKKAGQPLEVHSYEANHAFANPSSDSYKEKPAQEAYKITLNFLKGIFES